MNFITTVPYRTYMNNRKLQNAKKVNRNLSYKSGLGIRKKFREIFVLQISVGDPAPYVFRPPGSGSISTRYGSGSESFYNQAKIVRKTFIPPVL
jgi:hypothetical protein